jgi:hypothetical protein
MHCDKLQDDDTNSSTAGGGSTKSESAGWQYRQDTQIRRVPSMDKETAMLCRGQQAIHSLSAHPRIRALCAR